MRVLQVGGAKTSWRAFLAAKFAPSGEAIVIGDDIDRDGAGRNIHTDSVRSITAGYPASRNSPWRASLDGCGSSLALCEAGTGVASQQKEAQTQAVRTESSSHLNSVQGRIDLLPT